MNPDSNHSKNVESIIIIMYNVKLINVIFQVDTVESLLSGTVLNGHPLLIMWTLAKFPKIL